MSAKIDSLCAERNRLGKDEPREKIVLGRTKIGNTVLLS
jgi:hypothetical protein